MRYALPLLSFACGALAFGQSSTPPVSPVDPVVIPENTFNPNPRGETTLQLDIAFGTRFVAPSRVTVPVGERVTIVAPSAVGSKYAWRKDGHDLAGATNAALVIPFVGSADAGVYVAANTDPAAVGKDSQAVVLSVGPTARLVNVSTRGWVGGADKPFIGGFVVTTEGGTTSKRILLRAIGPSLAKFGVPNPLSQPTITIYDSAGRLYTNAYAYPAVVGGPTYETDLANALATSGAFSVPTGADAKDLTELRPFVAGTYSVVVGSADGSSGNVLFEAYEVP